MTLINAQMLKDIVQSMNNAKVWSLYPFMVSRGQTRNWCNSNIIKPTEFTEKNTDLTYSDMQRERSLSEKYSTTLNLTVSRRSKMINSKLLRLCTVSFFQSDEPIN